MTPITDRAEFPIEVLDDAKVVPSETARELEEMCEELYQAAKYWTPEEYAPPALARYQQLKEKAK